MALESIEFDVNPDAVKAMAKELGVSKKDAEAMLAQAAAEAEEAKEAEAKRKQLLENLALNIEHKFEELQKRRVSKENEWVESLCLWLGALSGADALSFRSPDRPFSPVSTLKRPDINIVRPKCDIALAQCISMQFAGGDQNWDILPSPLIDKTVDPYMAVEAAELMEKTIKDQQNKTQYAAKMREAMWNRVVLGTAIVKGPVNSAKLKRRYVQGETGQVEVVVDTEYCPEVFSVDPWFYFPDDTTPDQRNCQFAIEIHAMGKLEVSKLLKHPGFMHEEISALLKEPVREYTNRSYTEFSKLTDSNANIFRGKYCVLEYNGPINKDQLTTLGIDPGYDSPSAEYYGEVWVCQGRVIRVELSAIDALFEIPYSVCVWKKDPASIFGYGLPMILRDHQRVLTETWHMILDNSSISSGPQAIFQQNMVEPIDGVWEFDPGRIWIHKDLGQNVQNAVHFFVPPNVTGPLIEFMNLCRQLAEEESTVTLMSAGMGSPQVTDSATGLGILQQNSTLISDYMAEDWDDQITTPVIQRYYDWNMQYGENPAIKGDFEIDVKSSTEYKNKLLHIKNLEKLALESTQNPEMGIVLDPTEVTIARLNMMNLPSGKMVRSREEIAQIKEQQAQQGPPPEIQIKMQELELKKQQQELDKMKMEFEMNHQQVREAWEHEERNAANYARIAEAQAQVITAQTEKEIKLIELAIRSEMDMAKFNQQFGIATMQESTKRFLAGLEAGQKDRELLLKEKEADYAKKHGKGFL